MVASFDVCRKYNSMYGRRTIGFYYTHLNERNSVQCNDWNIIHRIGSRESLTQSTPVTCYITVMLQRESPWFLCDWNCRVISAYTQWMNGYIYIQWMWQWKYTVNQSIYLFTVLNRNGQHSDWTQDQNWSLPGLWSRCLNYLGNLNLLGRLVYYPACLWKGYIFCVDMIAL